MQVVVQCFACIDLLQMTLGWHLTGIRASFVWNKASAIIQKLVLCQGAERLSLPFVLIWNGFD